MGENIYSINHIYNNGLMSKIYKEAIQINSIETTWLKMGRIIEQAFFQRIYTNVQQINENGTEYQQVSEKCKSKPQYVITLHLLHWLPSKR